jgi:hypothetical protein
MTLEMNTGILSVIGLDTLGELSPEKLYEAYCERMDSSARGIRKYREREVAFDFCEYRDVLGKCGLRVLNEFFENIADKFNVRLLEGFKIQSPENSDVDCLLFSVKTEASEIEKVKNAVAGNKHFFDWIFANYRSRGGFISYMPYTKSEYLTALSDNGGLLSKAICLYLMFAHEKSIAAFEMKRDFYQRKFLAEIGKHGGWENYAYDLEYDWKISDLYATVRK